MKVLLLARSGRTSVRWPVRWRRRASPACVVKKTPDAVLACRRLGAGPTCHDARSCFSLSSIPFSVFPSMPCRSPTLGRQPPPRAPGPSTPTARPRAHAKPPCWRSVDPLTLAGLSRLLPRLATSYRTNPWPKPHAYMPPYSAMDECSPASEARTVCFVRTTARLSSPTTTRESLDESSWLSWRARLGIPWTN